MTPTDRVLSALRSGPMAGADLARATSLWAVRLYPALFKLERAGKVSSAWAWGPYPRRRVYSLREEIGSGLAKRAEMKRG